MGNQSPSALSTFLPHVRHAENSRRSSSPAVGAADALYKQDSSVFVESAHALQETRLPVDGGFILNLGAGFSATSGHDPGWGAGVNVRFEDPESLRWFNQSRRRASPVRHRDVVFKTRSSFKVDTSSSHLAVGFSILALTSFTSAAQNKVNVKQTTFLLGII